MARRTVSSLRIGPGYSENPVIVGRLLGGGDDFVAVGGDALHAAHHGFDGRRASVVVIRKQHVGVGAEGFQARSAIFGAFDFDVDGFGAGGDGGFENSHLLFDAAVEAAHVLVAAAGGEDGAVGVARQKLADGGDALFGLRQVVQAEFEEAFAGFVFTARVRQQRLGVGKTEGDADAREWSAWRHRRQNSISRQWGWLAEGAAARLREFRARQLLNWSCLDLPTQKITPFLWFDHQA